MTCAEIMMPSPKSVRENETIGRAAELILEHRYINLPVLDGEGKFVGTFGIYELLGLLVPRIALAGDLLPNLRFMSDDLQELRGKFKEQRDVKVNRAVNREATFVAPQTPIAEALRLFYRHHTTLPVIEPATRQLVGIVSYWDALKAVIEESR